MDAVEPSSRQSCNGCAKQVEASSLSAQRVQRPTKDSGHSEFLNRPNTVLFIDFMHVPTLLLPGNKQIYQ